MQFGDVVHVQVMIDYCFVILVYFVGVYRMVLGVDILQVAYVCMYFEFHEIQSIFGQIASYVQIHGVCVDYCVYNVPSE